METPNTNKIEITIERALEISEAVRFIPVQKENGKKINDKLTYYAGLLMHDLRKAFKKREKCFRDLRVEHASLDSNNEFKTKARVEENESKEGEKKKQSIDEFVYTKEKLKLLEDAMQSYDQTTKFNVVIRKVGKEYNKRINDIAIEARLTLDGILFDISDEDFNLMEEDSETKKE